MRRFALAALALAATTLWTMSGNVSAKAADGAIRADLANELEQPLDLSARKKVRHRRHAGRSLHYSYGYDRPYHRGYYRGVRPGWGYGPDPGDYAWPPFHFKPYW